MLDEAEDYCPTLLQDAIRTGQSMRPAPWAVAMRNDQTASPNRSHLHAEMHTVAMRNASLRHACENQNRW